MRVKRWALVAGALVGLCTGAQAGPYGLIGNDTGGIIPWSPLIAHSYRVIAADHCAGYNKVARITSVHRWYGDYVGFQCAFPRYYDPVKGWATVVVRVRY